ncbi:putative molybdenum carrier protein [Arenimonas sp.]|uniref:putative molybdenum carrier protein n=1 Tax=Arenimonas sp. TaxID=1872635 RepID=UPI0039E30102
MPTTHSILCESVDTVISGGQTGVDRAALDVAIIHGCKHGGWCPAGRKAEDGAIPLRYQLTETESSGYRQRTKRNVLESDGTLILNVGALDGGTLETLRIAERASKPVRLVALDAASWEETIAATRGWLRLHDIRVLNMAGPKESKRPGIHGQATRFLAGLITGAQSQDGV